MSLQTSLEEIFREESPTLKLERVESVLYAILSRESKSITCKYVCLWVWSNRPSYVACGGIYKGIGGEIHEWGHCAWDGAPIFSDSGPHGIMGIRAEACLRKYWGSALILESIQTNICSGDRGSYARSWRFVCLWDVVGPWGFGQHHGPFYLYTTNIYFVSITYKWQGLNFKYISKFHIKDKIKRSKLFPNPTSYFRGGNCRVKI